MEICKIAAFFEGGIQYSDLVKMPIDEFIEIISHAETINSKRKEEMNRV